MNTTIRMAALALAVLGVGGAQAQTPGTSTPSTMPPTTMPPTTTSPTTSPNTQSPTTTTPPIPDPNVTGPMVTGTGGGGDSYNVASGAQPTTGSDAGAVYGTQPSDQYGSAATDAGEPRQAGADNTRRNARDRDQGALTAQDQGSSPTDRKISANVRRELMDARLSFDAKNIKVITNGSRVTLRGPVSSEDEKARIQSLAEKVSGVTAVDNQLEVKK